MNLYLLKYNNYYNRKAMKFDTLAEYLVTPYYDNEYVENVNFNPNDGVNTTQVVNSNYICDYAILGEGTSIVSRWFVIESKRQRNGQYLLTLRRDLVADNYTEIINAPCFIEKATVSANDPAIFNNENMGFNQIKTSESLLKDKTGSAWVVGYIPKDSFSESTEITTNVLLEGTADITVDKLSDLPFYKYISQDYIGPVSNVNYKTITKLKLMSAYYLDTYTLNSDTLSKNLTRDKITEQVYNLRDVQVEGKQYTADDIYALYDTYKDNLLSQVNSLNGQSTDYTISDFKALIGKVIYDSESKMYYKVALTENKVNGKLNILSTSKLATEYWSPMITQNGALDITGTISDNEYYPSYSVTYDYINYRILLEQLSISSSVTLDNDRYHLNDQPFDMFCIPYSDTMDIYKNGTKLFTANKSLAVGIATAIGEKSGSANIYDIQVLPYCPISNIQQDGFIDILENKVDYITQNSVNVGVILWCTSSSFTVNIDKQITVDDYKISNECDVYRLVSPNYNGTFEFSPAKNNGVTGFIASCTYKPYNPYIRVAPIFNRLYGQDFKDARGLICQGDFSLPQVSSAWANYELTNKNYQNIFNRQIENMEYNNKMSNIQSLVGSGTSALSAGVTAGAVFGPLAGVGSGILSAVGGLADYGITKALQNETLDYTKDLFGYQLGNIKAIPNSLSKTSAINSDNKIFPVLEYYTCTDEEKQALLDKIKYNGMTIMRIGKMVDFLQEDYSYIKGQLIRLEIHEDTNYLNQIANEINKGVYIK